MTWLFTPLRSLFVLLLLGVPTQAETTLIMFEEAGCPYCAQWHHEVGVIYHKTDEGKVAKLHVQDLDDPLPKGVTIGVEPYYTPTFVLINNGKEVGRIEGYPGEDLFWGMMDVMMSKLPNKGKNS